MVLRSLKFECRGAHTVRWSLDNIRGICSLSQTQNQQCDLAQIIWVIQCNLSDFFNPSDDWFWPLGAAYYSELHHLTHLWHLGMHQMNQHHFEIMKPHLCQAAQYVIIGQPQKCHSKILILQTEAPKWPKMTRWCSLNWATRVPPKRDMKPLKCHIINLLHKNLEN